MRKHSGWYKNYLLFAATTDCIKPVSEYTSISCIFFSKSMRPRVVPQLRSLGQLHTRFSIYKSTNHVGVFARAYAIASYPTQLGMSVFFNLNLLRSLALRQYKVKRLLLGYPIRGQRSWSNANTARRCCNFFKQSISAYERELWGYSQPKKSRTLTKLDEARFSAQHRVVQRKRFVTKKIKTRKELVLRRKKRKKTPWR